jgi:uncharacterized coiled-coil protein SlyX
MGTLTKTFVVLNLIFCIAFVAVSAVVLSQRVHWKQEKFAVQAELDGKTKEWTADKRRFEEDQKKSSKTIEDLNRDLTARGSEIARGLDSVKLLKEDVKALQAEKIGANTRLGEALDTVGRQTKRAEALDTKLTVSKDKADKLQRTVDERDTSLMGALATGAALEVRVAELLHRLKASQEDLAWHKDYRKTVVRLDPELDGKASGKGGVIEYPEVPIRAAVKAVDKSIKIVILNVGSDNKYPVKKGYRFFIYRDQTFIAMAKVTNVEKDMCAAQIVPPETGLAIQVGDVALTEF